MPVQSSKRGQPVTPANYEAPFESNFTRFGVKGLNITDAIDAVEPDELTRMLNVTHRQDFGVTVRPGQTQLTNTVGTNHHSVRRLNDPTDNTYTRVYGIDTSLYQGQTTLNSIDSGYSGEPLSLVPYRPPFSNETWMFVADSNRMRKVRPDGLDLPIGLPAPGTAASPALGTQNKTVIASFSASDSTDAASWTGNLGSTYTNPPVPITATEIFDVTDSDGNPAIHFGALVDGIGSGIVCGGFYAYYGCAKTVDLSKVGSADATDDDYIHCELNFSHTQFIKEFRVYLVCSESFSPSILPGQTGTGGVNGDAYVKSFSSNDFAGYIQAQQIQTNAAEIARITSLRNDQLTESTPTVSSLRKAKFGATIPSAQAPVTFATIEQDRTIPFSANAGSDTWQSFGIVGIPLRRGDWQRIGNTANRGWNNITGIITYVQVGNSPDGSCPGGVAARISELYMTGGAGPDSGEPEASPYDYVYTNYDPRTGAEGNPSPVQTAATSIDSLRRQINVTPVAYGDGAVRQRFYRRGGTLPTDWFFLGENSSDGGVFQDTLTDSEVEAAGSVDDDNYQPVPTVDGDGNTVLNQPLNTLWGPLEDLLFGCGNPYAPGTVYFCKPGNPDSWPSGNTCEVCGPSEQVMTGCLYGGQAFTFSKERLYTLYPNFSGDGPSVSSSPTQCTRGIINRWALAVGISGMYFVANDGIYRTVGGPEDWISRKIDPLFRGLERNGMKPIDLTDLTAIRLEIFQNELYFNYRDTDGNIQCLVYSIPYSFWRQYTFGRESAVFYNDEGNADSVMLIGGIDSGETYTFEGTSDDGIAIPCSFRTGALNFGSPRLEKRFGDQWLDIDADGVEITLQNLLNYEALTNTAATVAAGTDRERVIFDPFGTTPQRGANLSTEISWSSAHFTPSVFQLGTTVINEPDITINRVTQWDDLGNADQFYLMGVTFDCDTGGVERTIIIERDYNGSISTVDTLSVTAAGRRKLAFSWSGAVCNKIRIRPTGDCDQWILYKADWNFQAQPPAISKWDSYFENGWDQYYTGLDLYCDTFGQNKTVECYVDGVLVKTETVNTNGRLVHHITIPWGRGHVFRFISTDDNPGVLYDFRWQLQGEPSEQTNWNQNFTIASAPYDKYLKAVTFECDTFGQDKTVTIECDGTVVETLTVNADGRKVVQKSFPQHLGRVFRAYPTDNNPSRLYSLIWTFDGEPLALDRWETQQITNGIDGWSYVTRGDITYKSDDDVTLSITAYNQAGTPTTKTYTLDSTAGVKLKRFVPFEAMKGILHKYVLTCDSAFWLYGVETALYAREWGSDKTAVIRPFGDSDLDPTRPMISAELAAARPGGQA